MSNTKITLILDDDQKTVTYEATGERAVCLLVCAFMPTMFRIAMDPEAMTGMSMVEVKKPRG